MNHKLNVFTKGSLPVVIPKTLFVKGSLAGNQSCLGL